MPGHYNGLSNKLKIVNFFPCHCSESQNNIAPSSNFNHNFHAGKYKLIVGFTH